MEERGEGRGGGDSGEAIPQEGRGEGGKGRAQHRRERRDHTTGGREGGKGSAAVTHPARQAQSQTQCGIPDWRIFRHPHTPPKDAANTHHMVAWVRGKTACKNVARV